MTVSGGVTSGRTQKVQQMNGHDMVVLSTEEKKFFNDQKNSYTDTYRLTERSDLNDLDRLLIAELQVFRMTRWLAQGEDYEQRPLRDSEVVSLNKSMESANRTISALKADLGMTRSARESGLDSTPDFLKDLLRRAREFGIHRERQVDEALSIMFDLRSAVHTFYRSNENERQKAGYATEAAIVEYIRDVLIPRFDAVDAHFREHQQKLWAGSL